MRAHLRRGAGLRGPVRALPRRARRRQEGAQEEGAQGAAEPRVLVVGDAASKRPPQPKRCRKCEAAMDEPSSSSGSAGDTATGS
uniref:Uncharacterized protein n=1 Tax=Zea mays TaxID=4577 RepID=A0A804LCW1_MAIZE